MIPKFEEAHMLLEKKVAAIVKTEEQKAEEAKEEIGCDVKITGEVGIVKEYLKDKKLIF